MSRRRDPIVRYLLAYRNGFNVCEQSPQSIMLFFAILLPHLHSAVYLSVVDVGTLRLVHPSTRRQIVLDVNILEEATMYVYTLHRHTYIKCINT